MSLWVDKYRPNSLSKLDYHKEQAQNLRALVNSSDFPHLLVYGPSGAGKKTRIICLLRELYGAGVDRLKIGHQTFTTPSNKKVEITTISSNYHIEVNPSDAGFYDRVVIQELIKNMAQTHQLETSTQKEFKVVVLNEVDRLTKDAQHALRRTMEKYITTCRLILCCTSSSRVISAIKSRCLGIRVAAPKEEDIVQILQNVCKKEGLNLPKELAVRISTKSGRNLRRALLACEAARVQQYPFAVDQVISESDWQVYLNETAVLIASEQSPKRDENELQGWKEAQLACISILLPQQHHSETASNLCTHPTPLYIAMLLEVRNRLYELLSHCIPPNVIFTELLTALTANCDEQLKMEVTKAAAAYEHRLQLGSKAIYHLEAFVAKFMSIYKTFLEASLAEML